MSDFRQTFLSLGLLAVITGVGYILVVKAIEVMEQERLTAKSREQYFLMERRKTCMEAIKTQNLTVEEVKHFFSAQDILELNLLQGKDLEIFKEEVAKLKNDLADREDVSTAADHGSIL